MTIKAKRTIALAALGALAACTGTNKDRGIESRRSAFSIPLGADGVPVSVTAGDFHACARLTDNRVVCWGQNLRGQLGDGTNATSPTPVFVGGTSAFVRLSAGQFHTCGVHPNGDVDCWGSGQQGQLGDGSFNAISPTPTPVSGLSNAVSVSAGQFHTCAVTGDHRVYCWGNGGNGQLGDGNATTSPVPVQVAGITDAVAVGVGSFHSCALRQTDEVECWGSNASGQLGSNVDTFTAVPVPVPGIARGVALEVGNLHNCVLHAGGDVQCWGDNSFGQVDGGQPVLDLSDAIAIAAGTFHTCATRATGDVVCWGRGTEGQLNGTMTNVNLPLPVPGVSRTMSIAAGSQFSCAVTEIGIQCWGSGLLGDGAASVASPPVIVQGSLTMGQSCANPNDCASGFCAQGICCATSCTATCKSCALPGTSGTCTSVPAGQDPLNQCVDAGVSTCGTDGTCNGAGACRLYAAGTPCVAPTCSGSTLTPARTCNGTGTCQTVSSSSCSPFACNPGACKATCTSNADCTSPNVCLGSVCAPSPNLKVQYRTRDFTPNDQAVTPAFRIFNTGTNAVALSQLTIRYWYTIDTPVDTESSFCDFAAIGSNNITLNHVTLAPTRIGADRYFQVGFTGTAGSLAAATNTGEIQVRFNKTSFGNYNENDDYSYDATKTTYADWGRVTLYQNGNLIWGIEPNVGSANGHCTIDADCPANQPCEDGLCCSTACGGSNPNDCEACSIAAGGRTDGTCTPVSQGTVCRPAAGACDLAETCSGVSTDCPGDAFKPGAVVCQPADACHAAAVCTGAEATCPPAAPIPCSAQVRGAVTWNGSRVPASAAADLTVKGVANSGPTATWVVALDSAAVYHSPIIPPGSYTISVEGGVCASAGTALASVDLAVAPSTTHDIDLTATAGLVTATVVRNGLPLQVAVSIGGGCSSLVTDANGAFASFLLPGTYTATPSISGSTLAPFSFSVQAGQTTDISALIGGTAGTPCPGGNECLPDLFCVDGVCCTSDCGGGDPTDCQACSLVAGGTLPGTCTLARQGVVCREALSPCDVAESCSGASTACPADTFKPAGTVCHPASNGCETTTMCTGTNNVCPPSTPVACTTSVQGTVSWNGSAVSGMEATGLKVMGRETLPMARVPWEVSVDASGFYQSPTILPVDYALVLSGGCFGASLAVAVASVLPGVATIRNFDISATAGRVTGTITSGGIPRQATIAIGCGTLVTDASGHVASFLPPGTYVATPSISGSTFPPFSFSVQAGQTTDISFAIGEPPGTLCPNGNECAADLFCVDGVCCTEACGDGDPTDCQACSTSAGGAFNGTCTPLANTHVCRGSAGECDPAETCDGTSPLCPVNSLASPGTICHDRAGGCDPAEVCSGAEPACPADTLAAAGAACRQANGGCDVAETCSGTSPACPADGFAASGFVCQAASNPCEIAATCSGGSVCPPLTTKANCTLSQVNTPAGPDSGAEQIVGSNMTQLWSVSIEFLSGVASAGVTSVATTSSGNPPPTGFRLMGIASAPYWDFETTAALARPDGGSPTIVICINYGTSVPSASESSLQILHDVGTPGAPDWRTLDKVSQSGHVLCVKTSSLSPFALVMPIDAGPPVFPVVPADIAAYATSTRGAVVTYTNPTAIDDVDGNIVASCKPASGTTFAPGKTRVICTATDGSGKTATTSFQVWVRFQAPTDGTFFLQPINPDGSSLFKRGSTIPVKFKLQGASAGITNLVAHLVVAKVSSGVTGTSVEADSTAACDSGNTFRYDPVARQYIFNLATKGMAAGTWSLRADLGDLVDHTVKVSLK